MSRDFSLLPIPLYVLVRNNREASLNGGAISPALSAQAGSPVAGTNPSDSNANDGPKTQFNSAEVSQYLQRSMSFHLIK